MSKPEMYISIDIETDGPSPGSNSMLALGAVAFMRGYEGPLESFYQKLEPLPDAMQNSDTMVFWAGQPEAWTEVTAEQKPPMVVMNDYAEWLLEIEESYEVRLTAVAWPAAFDFGFVNWYLHEYYGSNPLGFAALDIRSYANGLFGTPGYYEKISEGNLYDYFHIDRGKLRPHVAVDDAEAQGRLLMALIEYAQALMEGK